ncbi:hypothetical protein [Paenibacillus alvei]|uniref:hypothetical protein n=1 Tax=Paenibacillus alvei TaxID=44250 RepID=UPI00227FDA42|nr:hypothetical protein [Paenibacillus alvei]
MSFAELASIIREQGAAYNLPAPSLGSVVSKAPLAVKVGNLSLDASQLYTMSVLEKGDDVVIFPTADESKFVVSRVVQP